MAKFACDMLKQNGKLTVFYGCMFAGKTSSLIARISTIGLKPSELLVLKPAVDARAGSAHIVTHDGKSHACVVYTGETELADMLTPFTKVLALDEAQFFDKLFLTEIKRALGKGIDVIAAGLDMDYKGRPFGLMPRLLEIADEKQHLKAVCAVCGADAEHSYRKTPNNVLILIGQENHYEPRCKSCAGVV